MRQKASIRSIAILAVPFVMAMVCMFFSVNAIVGSAADPYLSGGELKASYWLGEELVIPKATISDGQKEVNARAVVYKPGGEALASSSLSLREAGIYTVVYSATLNGHSYSFEKEFVVNMPLYSVQSKKSTVSYGVDSSIYQTGKTGIQVSLVANDVFTYNDIIDLNQAEGNFLELAMMPMDGAGTKDLRKLIVTLTDIYNPTRQLTIILQCANKPEDGALWYLDNTYLLAGGENQEPTGYEAGAGKLHVNNTWGCAVNYSFYGMHGENVAVGKETLKLAYDKATKQVLANGAMVIDLDNLDYFDEAWSGFTTGEVKMSISGDEYSRVYANFMITKVGRQNLSREMVIDDVAPDINVEFDGYDETELPDATVGYHYPVFSATAHDKFSGAVDVQTRVYFNYTSNQRYQLNIEDGKFAPKRTGVYTIEYSAKDHYGNTQVKTVDIQCVEKAPAFSAAIKGDYPREGLTGQWIEIADIQISGGVGQIVTYATVESSALQPTLIEGGFRPELSGVYKVTLHAEDMIGQHVTANYEVVVTANSEPVFLDEVLLPKYLMTGYTYQIPALPAYDFSNGKEEIATSITVVDGNGEKALSSKACVFTPDRDGYATIIYKAEGKAGSSQKEYRIPVILAKEGADIHLERYFQGEKITSAATRSSVTVSATENAEYMFINDLVADNFSVSFAISQNKFSTLQLIFTDSVDESVCFTIEIDKGAEGGENALLRINGVATKYRPSAGFYGGNNFFFTYDNVKGCLTDDKDLEAFIKNADGTAFAGFPSGKMYMRVKMLGVAGESSVAWKSISTQVLSDVKTDSIRPMISVLGAYKSNYQFGTVAEIYSAVAGDVISPEVYSSLSVRTPGGEYVKDIEGNLLNKVPLGRSYFISLEQYGSYSIVYTAEDANGRDRSYYYSISVIDDVKPTIKLTNLNATTAKVGETIKIAEATAFDNVDGEVDVYVYVKDSDGILQRAENGGSFRATKRGVYEIHYMAFDTYGNLAIEVCQITVK